MRGTDAFCFALGSLVANFFACLQETAKLCCLVFDICERRRNAAIQSRKSSYSLLHREVGACADTVANNPAFVFEKFVFCLVRLIVNYCYSVRNDRSPIRIGKSRGIANSRDVEHIVCREPYTFFHTRFLNNIQPVDLIGRNGSFRLRSSRKLYHSAKMRNQLDNIAGYAVAWHQPLPTIY